jgi:hypothetical protein
MHWANLAVVHWLGISRFCFVLDIHPQPAMLNNAQGKVRGSLQYLFHGAVFAEKVFSFCSKETCKIHHLAVFSSTLHVNWPHNKKKGRAHLFCGKIITKHLRDQNDG